MHRIAGQSGRRRSGSWWHGLRYARRVGGAAGGASHCCRGFFRSQRLSYMCSQVLVSAHCVLGALFAWLGCMMCSSAPCDLGAWQVCLRLH
jgi:hypothetical protein